MDFKLWGVFCWTDIGRAGKLEGFESRAVDELRPGSGVFTVSDVCVFWVVWKKYLSWKSTILLLQTCSSTAVREKYSLGWKSLDMSGIRAGLEMSRWWRGGSGSLPALNSWLAPELFKEHVSNQFLFCFLSFFLLFSRETQTSVCEVCFVFVDPVFSWDDSLYYLDKKQHCGSRVLDLYDMWSSLYELVFLWSVFELQCKSTHHWIINTVLVPDGHSAVSNVVSLSSSSSSSSVLVYLFIYLLYFLCIL